MIDEKYIEEAMVTDLDSYKAPCMRLCSESMSRVLHASIGLATEAGEVLDAVKKHIYYGKELDETNLIEELGDIFWYMAMMADELGADFSDIKHRNIKKLRARFGDKFSEKRAQDRDLVKERKILETKGA